MIRSITLFALPGIPRIEPGHDVAELIVEAAEESGFILHPKDVLVVAHKILSKAENRRVSLSDVMPGPEAIALGNKTGKDPRLAEMILRESQEIVKVERSIIIARHRHGFVCANAGVDQSNVGRGEEEEKIVLLPTNPDKSALELQQGIEDLTGICPAVIVADTQGRAFRNGAIGIAIGSAGIATAKSWIGLEDMDGRRMISAVEAVGDEIAGAATLLMGQGAEGQPVVIVRGVEFEQSESGAAALIREPEEDLFR